MKKYKRNEYDEIVREPGCYVKQGKIYESTTGAIAPRAAFPGAYAILESSRLVEEMKEHTRQTGWAYIGMSDFDRKGRGEAVNWSLYAAGIDIHNRKRLYIVQVRKWSNPYVNGYSSTRKNYFLIGRNEDKTVFAHVIESRVVRYAISNGIDPIVAAQSWMFSHPYAEVERQGDIGFVKVKRNDPSKYKLIEKPELPSNHYLASDQATVDGKGVIYVLNPVCTHPTHPKVNLSGWWKVVVAKRKQHWEFTKPTPD